ncbi:MAG: MBL fold metallo-hydrolase [Bacteroidia bacterium]
MSESWHSNPELPFIHNEARGNRMIKDRFAGFENETPVGFKTVMKWMFSANPQRKEKKLDTFKLPLRPDRRIFEETADAFNWLGHSAFLLRTGGKLLLTDPCLLSSAGLKRLVPSPFAPEDITGLDAVLLSHAHRDHLDEASMKRIIAANRDAVYYVPLKTAPLLQKLGARNIIEAAWYQQYPAIGRGGPEVIFLPAKHWNRRWLTDTNRTLWGSFVIRSAARTIYFAGDTAMSTHFSETGKLFPEISHAFMPVGAYKPHYMMNGAHINPDEALSGFHELGAKHFIPMHYGTYDLSDEPISEPLRIMQNHEKEGRLNGKLIAPAVGETVLM